MGSASPIIHQARQPDHAAAMVPTTHTPAHDTHREMLWCLCAFWFCLLLRRRRQRQGRAALLGGGRTPPSVMPIDSPHEPASGGNENSPGGALPRSPLARRSRGVTTFRVCTLGPPQQNVAHCLPVCHSCPRRLTDRSVPHSSTPLLCLGLCCVAWGRAPPPRAGRSHNVGRGVGLGVGGGPTGGTPRRGGERLPPARALVRLLARSSGGRRRRGGPGRAGEGEGGWEGEAGEGAEGAGSGPPRGRAPTGGTRPRGASPLPLRLPSALPGSSQSQAPSEPRPTRRHTRRRAQARAHARATQRRQGSQAGSSHPRHTATPAVFPLAPHRHRHQPVVWSPSVLVGLHAHSLSALPHRQSLDHSLSPERERERRRPTPPAAGPQPQRGAPPSFVVGVRTGVRPWLLGGRTSSTACFGSFGCKVNLPLGSRPADPHSTAV